MYNEYNALNTQRSVTAPGQYAPGLALNDQLSVAFLNAGASTQQAVLVDNGTAAADTDYVFNIGGKTITITYVVADGDPFNGVAPGTAISDAILQNLIVSKLQQNQTDFTVAATSTNQVTLTAVPYSVNKAVAVSGGGTGFAVNTNTAANSSSHIPFGVVVVDSGSDADGKLGALPSATGQKVLGISRRGHGSARYSYAESQALGLPQDGIFPGTDGTAMKQGSIAVRTEAAFTGTESAVFFRHTADGALTNLGYVAPATGTGLDALTAVSVDGPSVVLEDGSMVVPVTVNMP
ncbi:hypothetical protein D0962_04345 [Leptolyngbyaceae cyanobacterium CCMR0082]|uniref:Uncharacterized protein n=1 Tax=Adonisia turfae CCMR0082 TaxID=2304604 RepID=A0A6M0S213_9CYAN|nr:hypothetical protein [Adonisia turfae]NEZ62011.1 hypothetical protein [Adonisia turfae CCMR0082]